MRGTGSTEVVLLSHSGGVCCGGGVSGRDIRVEGGAGGRRRKEWELGRMVGLDAWMEKIDLYVCCHCQPTDCPPPYIDYQARHSWAVGFTPGHVLAESVAIYKLTPAGATLQVENYDMRHHQDNSSAAILSPLFVRTRDIPPTSTPLSLAISRCSSLPSHRRSKASSRILVSLFLRTSVSLQSQRKSAKCATLAQTPVSSSKQAPSLPPSPMQSPTLPHLRRGEKEIPRLTMNPP